MPGVVVIGGTAIMFAIFGMVTSGDQNERWSWFAIAIIAAVAIAVFA